MAERDLETRAAPRTLALRTPAADLLPVAIEGLRLSEVPLGRIVSLAPLAGQGEAVSALLTEALGLEFAAPGRISVRAGAGFDSLPAVQWFARDAAMLLLGERTLPVDEQEELWAALRPICALCDQDHAFVSIGIEGTGASDVLARLVPLDLRARSFGPGATARSLMRHSPVSLSCTAPGQFRMLAARSMTASLLRDLKTAMEAVAARG